MVWYSFSFSSCLLCIRGVGVRVGKLGIGVGPVVGLRLGLQLGLQLQLRLQLRLRLRLRLRLQLDKLGFQVGKLRIASAVWVRSTSRLASRSCQIVSGGVRSRQIVSDRVRSYQVTFSSVILVSYVRFSSDWGYGLGLREIGIVDESRIH